MSSRHWRRIPGLPLQLFILTVLPLTVLLMLIAFGSLGLHQQAMRTMVGERDERATRAASAAISEQINHRQLAIHSIARQAANAATGPEHALADAAYLLPDFEGGIALFAADDTLVSASNSPEIWLARAVPERLRDLPSPSFTETAFFLPPFTDPVQGETLVLVAATVGEITAVGAFFPASLARRATADIFGGNDQATAYLVTSSGEVLYQTGTLLWADLPAQNQPGIADALRGESGTTYLTVDGEEYVIAFSPIPPVGWALVIEEPWRAMTDPMLRTTELAPLVTVQL